jgi:hypothetical protein
MSKIKCLAIVVSVAAVSLASTASQAQQPPPQSPNMTFFITSAGPGKGADLGGLEGADRQCQTLAQNAGAGNKTWRAYLSTQATGGAAAVNARDRIGGGPWQNFKGEIVAQNADDLHSDNNKLGMQTSLTERGTVVAGVGYTPNAHDVLTGSQPDGRAFPPGEDRTCRNWTSGTQGAAMVGHSDRRGLRDDAASKSWNSSHPSRGPDGGCSQNDLRSTGGNGLFYCFADGEHWARHGRWREVRLRTLATPEPIKDWSLTSLKEKLIKIGAKVVSHGRYIAFQMAEVAIPRQMFQDILRLIAELRPQPPPTPA